MAEESQVAAFYSHKKILITGGSGLMGKVLIWKLLQSCPKVETIFMLMRQKYGRNSTNRKADILDAPIFDNFKKNNPEVFEKVIFISGDVGEEGIGLSEQDRNTLIEEVSIVFHGAAILKMDANLRTAVNVNTVGTIRMLDLATKMKKLDAFVHISTAFCCCENATVEEKIYLSKHNPYDIINLIQWMEPEMLKKITPKLIFPLPNTYVYSKRLTESLLPKYESQVPIIIARPSIVAPSFKEPIPGWCDSLNGPVGFYAAAGKGVIRTFLADFNVSCDMIPLDFAINGIITLPWTNPKEHLLKEISVYNICRTAHEDLTWNDISAFFRKASEKYPFEKILWYPLDEKSTITSSIVVYTIKSMFLHYLPAYIIDFILLLVGQKPFLVKVHDKLRHAQKVIGYFVLKQWVFLHDNLLKVEKLFNDADKRIFPINMNEMKDLQNYADNATIGTKLFIFKEDINKLSSARRLRNIMYVVDKIALFIRYVVLLKILIFIFNIILDIFQV